MEVTTNIFWKKQKKKSMIAWLSKRGKNIMVRREHVFYVNITQSIVLKKITYIFLNIKNFTKCSMLTEVNISLWKGSTVSQYTVVSNNSKTKNKILIYVTSLAFWEMCDITFLQMKSSNSNFELCPGCDVCTSQKDYYRMLNL